MILIDPTTNYYGLLRFGGARNSVIAMKNICYMAHGVDTYHPFTTIGKLCDGKTFASPIQIGSHIMVIGGYQVILYPNTQCKTFKNVEWFDLETRECSNEYISSCNYHRSQSATCYDKLSQCVYCGGGHSQFGLVVPQPECYNIHKNKWYKLGSTILDHSKGISSIWMDKNRVLLFIMSRADRIECIDLRDRQNEWSAVTQMDKTLMFPRKWPLLLL